MSVRRGAPWLAAAAAVVCGLPLVGRGFTSEDFLLLRFLAEQPPWDDWAALLTGPWLGIDVVRFYRPLSELLLAVEVHLFGARAWLYGALHLAVHAGNVALVYRLGAQLTDGPGDEEQERTPWGPFAAAFLFAVHPLHPNAVAWIASYATLFATAFSLAAVTLWLDWRRGGGGGRWAASLVCFAAALGSYEAAVVVPLLLAGAELLPTAGGLKPAATSEDARSKTPMWRRVSTRRPFRALALAPFFALLAGYLLLRRAIFGAVVGGYESFANRLAPSPASSSELASWGSSLAADAASCLFRLLHPIYVGPFDAGGPGWAPWVVAAWIVAPALLMLRSGGPPALRRWAFAGLWTVAAFLPFAFEPFVPANGRYAYFAVAGLALGVGCWVAAGRRAASPALRLAAPVVAVALALQWSLLLVGTTAAHRRAGAEAARIAERLAPLAAASQRPVFVVGHPIFVRDASGTPLAQVYHYGLSDSLRPPFRDAAAAPVYPLPLVDARSAAALREVPGIVPVAWSPAAGDFAPLAEAPLPRFETRVAGDVVSWPSVPAAGRYRLVVAAEGNPAFVEVAAPDCEAALPLSFVRSMRTLYASPAWYWVEAWKGHRLLATSRPATLP